MNKDNQPLGKGDLLLVRDLYGRGYTLVEAERVDGNKVTREIEGNLVLVSAKRCGSKVTQLIQKQLFYPHISLYSF